MAKIFIGGEADWTYVVSKRPMRGHGREIIQLGLPVVDPPEAKNSAPISKERRSEPIPTLLEDVIDRFVGMQIMPVKPDAAVIDIYNEGDHSQPHMWPSWFGKPVSVLFLSKCDLTFGRLITAVHPGDYKGSLKLSLAPGSLLVMQGRSTVISKHAIPSTRKQRILVTFTKFQPRKLGSSSHWGPPPSRSPSHIRHSGPKHYSTIPTTGVLPAPANRGQNGVPGPPLFVAAPAPAVSSEWAVGPTRHPPNSPPAPPGTGVFLPPPGSGNASAGTETNFQAENKENGPEKSDSGNCTYPSKEESGQDCNGIENGGAGKGKHHENGDHTG